MASITLDQLIEEGRQLQRPTVFLRPQGTGAPAARWYETDKDEIESTGFRCWLTVDCRHVPQLPETIRGYITLFTDEERCKGGRVELSASWPDRPGMTLYAHAASVLPPIDAVFARGSKAVSDWIHSHGWTGNMRYNDNFGDAAIVDKYERLYQSESPFYSSSDVYAILGGWHLPNADDDWHHLLDEQLMIFTLHDSEPWVEAWRTGSGFQVIQRTT